MFNDENGTGNMTRNNGGYGAKQRENRLDMANDHQVISRSDSFE